MSARHVLLSGPPGAGKSTLGPRLAESLRFPFVDLDAEVQRVAGRNIAELFARSGEAGFRALEREVFEAVLAREAAHVVALGGGSLLDTEFRRRVLETHTVLGLRAPERMLVERVRHSGGPVRPLLEGDLATRVAELAGARAEAYAEVHASVVTETSMDDATHALVEAARRADMVVPLGGRSYPIFVSDGLLRAQIDAWCTHSRARVSLWVVDDVAYAHHAALFDSVCAGTGARLIRVPGGESSKRLRQVELLWDLFAAHGLERSQTLGVAGGGAVLDAAAFAASTWHRGTPHVLVPTTLLAMADASIGGKTGVDTASGKNLVGSVAQPRAVFVDRAFLSSVPVAQWRSDQAELLKAAALADAGLADELVTEVPASASALRRGLRVKARLVASDEHDLGDRALLNFGHTVGHALELASGFTLNHGDAVAQGMHWELRAAVALGLCDASVAAHAVAQLQRLGFAAPTGKLDASTLSFLARDKKVAAGSIRFAVLRAFGVGQVEAVALTDLMGALVA